METEAQASARVLSARSAVARFERKLSKARGEVERLAEAGAGRRERVTAQLLVEDCERGLEAERARVVEAEAALARLKDASLADRLEHLGGQLAAAAAEIDVGMVELVKKFERHRSVMLAIAKLSPSVARSISAQHQRAMPARAASQACGLEKHLPCERVIGHAAAPFGDLRCPALEAEIRRLRDGSEAGEQEAA